MLPTHPQPLQFLHHRPVTSGGLTWSVPHLHDFDWPGAPEWTIPLPLIHQVNTTHPFVPASMKPCLPPEPEFMMYLFVKKIYPSFKFQFSLSTLWCPLWPPGLLASSEPQCCAMCVFLWWHFSYFLYGNYICACLITSTCQILNSLRPETCSLSLS